MRIDIDYYLKEDGNTRLMHTTITEDDIIGLLQQQFYDGDLACPMQFNREKVKVEFSIAKVTL